MRILFIVPNVPSSIRPRPLHFIRGLSRSHEVSVICLATNDSDKECVPELRQHCHRVDVIRLSRWRSVVNCLRALSSRKSLRCAYFESPQMRAWVKARVEAGEVDLIHAEHLKSVPMVAPVLGKIPVLFDAVDCVSMLESRRQRVTRNALVRLFAWLESKKLALAEAKAAGKFNRVTISASADRDAYPVTAVLRNRIDIIPNGVDLDHFAFRKVESQNNLLVFCAKLDYFPNEDAALYFARSVWPMLRDHRPELELQIVGSRPPRSVRLLDGRNSIRVIGSVPDVRPYLGKAWVALCPIRIRAGIQNKMLEAMAMGVPLVATPICQQGLKVEAGKHLLLAEKPEEFAAAIELLLENEMLRERLIAAGRSYVERHHNWADSVTQLSDSYTKALADFRAVPSISPVGN